MPGGGTAARACASSSTRRPHRSRTQRSKSIVFVLFFFVTVISARIIKMIDQIVCTVRNATYRSGAKLSSGLRRTRRRRCLPISPPVCLLTSIRLFLIFVGRSFDCCSRFVCDCFERWQCDIDSAEFDVRIPLLLCCSMRSDVSHHRSIDDIDSRARRGARRRVREERYRQLSSLQHQSSSTSTSSHSHSRANATYVMFCCC